MSIKTIRLSCNMTLTSFAKYFNIPLRTLQNWELGLREPPLYLVELIYYKAKNEKLIN